MLALAAVGALDPVEDVLGDLCPRVAEDLHRLGGRRLTDLSLWALVASRAAPSLRSLLGAREAPASQAQALVQPEAIGRTPSDRDGQRIVVPDGPPCWRAACLVGVRPDATDGRRSESIAARRRLMSAIAGSRSVGSQSRVRVPSLLLPRQSGRLDQSPQTLAWEQQQSARALAPPPRLGDPKSLDPPRQGARGGRARKPSLADSLAAAAAWRKGQRALGPTWRSEGRSGGGLRGSRGRPNDLAPLPPPTPRTAPQRDRPRTRAETLNNSHRP
jgi:hypothetical protein